ncbi:MAG TPA: class I SAM-dependent methyltransferase [Candidatus Methanoperedens sp.]|nr:class I SAM-dependent methyltransferase [Candidatus Methanoperedens sp.]
MRNIPHGALRFLEALLGLGLRRLVRWPPVATTITEEEMVARTEGYNEAAERYFAEYSNPESLLAKPFSDALHCPQYLFNLGVLFHGLKVSPGDLVVEMGAGSCWVSHFLNRYGCPTVSVDISPTALELGRKLFERSSATRWDLEPRFLPYGGHRLPLADASADRMVWNDAFHHVPNQRELLREMARVLRDDGIVAMCEPGRVHSATADSRREMEETGVLENDIVVEDLERTALECGFSRVTLLPLTLESTPEIPAAGLRDFLTGHGVLRYWARWSTALLSGHFILLYKGEWRPTTRKPGRLLAEIARTDGGPRLAVRTGERAAIRCRITNRGDTRWLHHERDDFGCARLGAHLYPAGSARAGDNFDWHRTELPRAIDPGESVELEVRFPPLAAGRYRVVLDMVAEHVTWFAQRTSPVLELELEVG